jgi:hypothetical protein
VNNSKVRNKKQKKKKEVIISNIGQETELTDLIGIIGVHGEGVEMGSSVVLGGDVLLGEEVLALVSKDDVHLAGSRTTDIRSKHDVVRRLSLHVLGGEGAGEKLDVSSSTVNVLLVLDRVLDDELLSLVGELGHWG